MSPGRNQSVIMLRGDTQRMPRNVIVARSWARRESRARAMGNRIFPFATGLDSTRRFLGAS